MTSVLAFSGSSRQGSFNQMTVNAVASHLDDVTHVDLGSLDLPIYNGDWEAENGLPAGAVSFKEQLAAHDALIIGSPEYNGFMTPLLLNAINWSTRSAEAGVDLSGFYNKPILIVTASPGGFGGMRGAVHLKTMLSGIGAIVLPDNFAVPGAMGAFDENGAMKDEGLQGRAAKAAERLVYFAESLK